MARLNEPPASAETLEGLKRRFVRQNRDLARSNSTQSVKIRQQELEIAHLLSENATLRQRILQLEHEVAASSSDDIRNGVDAIRQRLEAQLRDFTKQVSGTLGDLSNLQKKPKRRKSQIATSPKRSPARREWKNTSTLCEVLASQGQTMPTIVEDKHFPRRTLGVEEIQELHIGNLLDLRESPVVERPITFLDRADASSEQADQPVEQDVESNSDPSILGSVEIRRKRRHSSLLSENQESQGGTEHPLKIGARRKFAVPNSRVDPPEATKAPTRVLAEKSVNTDPIVSPRKAQPAVVKKSTGSELRAPVKKAVVLPYQPEESARGAPDVVDIKPGDEIAIKHEPITPSVGLSLFSPPSTQPPTADEAKGRPGTPPPASDTGSIGRGSRRSRPAVSYAEPKLNSKMRRPGKVLADAVTAKREESVTRENEGDTEDGSQRVVHIKRELGSMSNMASDRDKASALSPSYGRDKVSLPASGLNAVLNQTTHAPDRKPDTTVKNTSAESSQTAEDVFEVAASPPKKPPALPELSDPSLNGMNAAPRATAHRRTASAASVSSTSTNSTLSNGIGIGIQSGSLRRARRQTLAGTANGEAAAANSTRPASVASGSVTKEVKTTRSVSNLGNATGRDKQGVLARSNSTAGASNVRAERAARIAERRRSMML